MIVTKGEESREDGYMRGQPDVSGNKPAKTESGGNFTHLLTSCLPSSAPIV